MGHRVNRVLLDTHVLLWWFQGGEQLSKKARSIIEDAETDALVSAVSVWEIAIKYRAGKLDAAGVISNLETGIELDRFDELPLTSAHALRAGLLKGNHKDPFDRALIAQAQCESVPVISTDTCFDRFGVQRIW